MTSIPNTDSKPSISESSLHRPSRDSPTKSGARSDLPLVVKNNDGLGIPPDLCFKYVQWQSPAACCERTIQSLAEYNTMMVCDQCYSWVKVFDDRDAFRRFLEFCNSRSREVVAFCRSGRYFAIYMMYSSHSSHGSMGGTQVDSSITRPA